jgi:hypothetical protein
MAAMSISPALTSVNAAFLCRTGARPARDPRANRPPEAATLNVRLTASRQPVWQDGRRTHEEKSP